jgi:hypothetical protein
MHVFFDVMVFAAGFGACWLSKDTIACLVTGGEAFVRSLEAKAALLKARL